MSAELAPVTSIEDYREKPDKNDSEIHPVEDSVESRPETKELMIGFEREKMRDRDAIQTFIDTRDILWNGGHSQRTLDQAIYEAAVAYDAIMATPISHWGSDPEKPKAPIADLDPESTNGLLDVEVSLPKVEPSDNFIEQITKAKEQAIEDTKKWYSGRRDKDSTTLNEELNDKLNEINKRYSTKVQGGRTLNDLELYASYNRLSDYGDFGKDSNDKDLNYYQRKLHWGTVKNRGLNIKAQIRDLNPAIEASNRVKQAAISEGKTLDEAYDEGAAEYQKVLKRLNLEADITEPEKTEEGKQEARAIDAFNNVRDAYVSPSMRHGKFQHGWTLHNAAYAYEESLHIAHAGHGEHSEEHGHTEHSHSHSGTSSPDLNSNSDPNSATSPEAETQPDKKKIGKVLGKIGHAITREHRVLTSREFDQAGKSPTGMGEYGMNGDDYVLSLTEDIQPKWFKEWKAKAETRKNERKARKNQVRDQRRTQKDQRNDQLDQEVAKRLATIRESKWRREGVDLIKDIRRYNRSKNQANNASKDEKEQ